MAKGFIEYSVVVDTKTGEANVRSLGNAFDVANSSAGKLNTTISQTTYTLNGLSGTYQTTSTGTQKVAYATDDLNKKLGQTANKSGLAGAAVVEIGRTISDANYGMMAMANNLQQVATLMVTLISTSGGLKNGFSLLLSAFKGPLGFIVLFQIAISLIERFSMSQRKAKKETEGLTQAIVAQTGILQTLGNFATVSGDALDALRRNFKEVGEFLDEAERTNFGLSPEIIDFAIEQGKKLLSAREQIKTITSQLNDTDKENILTQKEREALQLKLVDAYEAESQALNKLKVAKSDDLVLTNETNEALKEREKLDLVKTIDPEYQFKQAKIFLDAYVELYGKLADRIEKELKPAHEASKNAIKEFLDSNDVIEAAEIKRRQGEEESAKLTAKWLGVIREEHIMTWQAVGDAMSSMSSILGEQTRAGKALAVAGALIDTYSAIAKTLNAFAPKAVPGYAIAQSIAIGLFGMAQVKKILSVPVPGGKGGGSAGSMAAPTQAPTFNIVGTSGASQLREAVEGGLNRPIKAYVTQKDISTSAELERSTRKTASII
jgi:hypothetical protein